MLSRGKALIDLALKNQNKTKQTKKGTVPLFINKPDRVSIVNSNLKCTDEDGKIVMDKVIDDVCKDFTVEEEVCNTNEAENLNAVKHSSTQFIINVTVAKEKANVVANDLNDEMLDVTVEDGEYMFIEERIQGALVEGSKYKEDSDIESLSPLFSETGSEYLPSGSDMTTDDEMPNLEDSQIENNERSDHDSNNEDIEDEITEETKGRKKWT
ncbi:uncharacterized protein LOC124356134 [Homalodisca vitripennis]|uniref:uncharacterized protein LOC124356134 n=1 Tax=Homalodisca vitripennis TaxID=197043 RepID=UPI001EE9DEE5|nr:uncharacterized protein LOC124356134 [Homalodisca vitripennis]